MTTKEQERKALAQIRKIVEGLGENSYVATAFEGCFEVAEQNIEWDAALSWKEEAELAGKKIAEYKKVRDDLVSENEKLKEELELTKKSMRKEADDKSYWIAMYREIDEANTTNWNNFREMEDRNEALLMEIIKLKARLFDLIDKQ